MSVIVWYSRTRENLPSTEMQTFIHEVFENVTGILVNDFSHLSEPEILGPLDDSNLSFWERPFPTSVAATVNLSWLCNIDSLLSGRRYLDSYLELILSILPTTTILIYSSSYLMNSYPNTVSFILSYVTFVNWIMLAFYSWEISSKNKR